MKGRELSIPSGLRMPMAVAAIIVVLLIGAIAVPVAFGNNPGGLLASPAKQRASISLTTASTDLVVGSNVHINGVLSGLATTSNAKIALKVALPDGTSARPVQGSITYTAAGGGFAIDYVPVMSGKHVFTATLTGSRYSATATDEVYVNAASGSSSAGTSAKASAIDLTLASSSITQGTAMHADGVLSAGAAISGAAVRLLVSLPDGTTAYPVQGSTVTTDQSGRFAMDYTPASTGIYRFTASYDGSALYNSSVTTASFSVAAPFPVVKAGTSIELALTSSSVDVGSTVHASGQLKSGDVIAAATITLKVVLPDGSTAAPVQGSSVVTDSQGRFVVDYVPTVSGQYTLIASFAGSDQYTGSSVSAAFTAYVPAPVTTVEAKYVVSNVGGIYYAKDSAGNTVASGSRAATVINAAISALTPNRTVKEKVSLVSGSTYTLASAIQMRSYCILDATGAFITATTSTSFVVGGGIRNFEVIGGDWDAHAMASGSGDRVVSLGTCSYGVIKGLAAHDHYYDAIEVGSSTHITVSGVEVGRVGHTALVMGNCSDCVVENCHFYDCAGGGGCYFLCEGGTGLMTSNNILRNNTVERTYLSGLSVASLRDPSYVGTNNLAEHNTAIDCGLDGTHPGIACGWTPNLATNCIIRYNNIYETGNYWPPNGNGTQVGISAACSDSKIYGNTISKTYDGGIAVVGPRNLVYDNTITAVSPKGGYGCIVLSDIADNNEIYNNKFYGPTNYGITTEGTASGNLVHDNYFEGMTGGMAVLLSTTSGNQIVNNTYRGIGTVYNGGSNIVSGNIPAA